jgi:hypothetical protein
MAFIEFSVCIVVWHPHPLLQPQPQAAPVGQQGSQGAFITGRHSQGTAASHSHGHAHPDSQQSLQQLLQVGAHPLATGMPVFPHSHDVFAQLFVPHVLQPFNPIAAPVIRPTLEAAKESQQSSFQALSVE